MNKKLSLGPWSGLLATASLLLILSGCGGSSSASDPLAAVTVATPETIAPGVGSLVAASSLKIEVTKVTIDGPPVIDFTVTNQLGEGMTGLSATDLRFNIAKLAPATNGEPSDWQNYISRSVAGAVQGGQERVANGYVFGSLSRLGSGRYTYRFATDIKNPVANPCPAPCTDANGKALDLRYEPAVTHRVTIQQANSAYPQATGAYDFVPNGSAVTNQRDIVATSSCNTCHAQLSAHGTRVDTKLCVTCHNPGSWVAGAPNVTVDFKVMVHRIHYSNGGLALPSVLSGSSYKIGSKDFSAVTFPQDSRGCTRCHDGTLGASPATVTPQGNHWKTEPSIAACSACHDNVYFGLTPDPSRPYQTKPHSGGVRVDSSSCAMCHAVGKFSDAKDISVAHDFPARLKSAAGRFEYRILSVLSASVGARPVITFSVTDPTRGNAAYDIKTAPAFTAGASSTLTVKLGWTTGDFANNGSGQAYGQPVSINALSLAATPGANAGTYTVTSPVPIPSGQSGSLRVIMDGHPAADVTKSGVWTDRLAVKSVYKDVGIGVAATARRLVVDVAKCNVCHDVLSLHGNNRSNEIGVCTVCHNPDATDRGRRPPVAGVDGKLEEAIDFKTMVHAIHAGEASQGGTRSKGLVVYGFGGSVNDFSKLVFPGRLSDCATCHIDNSYQLTGLWDSSTASGIHGTTVSTAGSSGDGSSNIRISPTAAVCASCHDSSVAKLHMQDPGNGGNFSATQAVLNATVVEGCSLCHGAGKVFDVKTVHGVK